MRKKRKEKDIQGKTKSSFKENFIESGKEHFGQMKKDSYVLRVMVKKNFKAQYRGSILGILWTVLNPLLNMLVLSFVFANMFGRGTGNYPVYILCGTIIFNIMRQVTSQSLTCIVGNAGIIKKTRISYSVLPLSNTFTALVNFSFSFIALIIVMLIYKQQFYWTILLTLTIVPAVTLFSLGIGYFLSSLYAFFRDIKHIYSVGLTLWQYLTPIFYTATAIGSATATKIINLNPMTVYVTAFRDIIQWGTIPSGITYLIMYGWAFGLLAFGYLVFKLNRRKYILYI